MAVCIAALSSCVAYDDYGYAGGGYYGGSGVVTSGYGYYPGYSSIGFFGLGGRGFYGSNYYDRDHHHHHYSSGYRQSAANRYVSSVARPSSHRGSVSTSRPSIPSVSVPRGLSRPSTSSLSRPSTSRSSSYRAPSVRPSSPRITTTSSRPSVSRSSASRPSSSRSSSDRRSR